MFRWYQHWKKVPVPEFEDEDDLQTWWGNGGELIPKQPNSSTLIPI